MKKKHILPLIIIITCFIIVYLYIRQEQKIYYWDYAGYWNDWKNFYNNFLNSPISEIKQLFHSIRSDDYNLSPIVLPSIFNVFSINSRLAYILSISFFYLIPTVLIFSKICLYITNNNNMVNKVFIVFFAVFFTTFWAPTLRGYPDICGLVFVLLSILYCIKFDMGKEIKIWKSFYLGLLLWMPFLMRRWYAYTIISLYVSLPFLNYFLYRTQKVKIKLILANFCISGLFSLTLGLFFQFRLIQRILHTNYSYIYSAYQSPFLSSLSAFIHFTGIYIICISFLGFLYLLFKQKNKEIILSVFAIFNLIFSFYLFTRTQAPGIQHILPFSLWILLVAAISILTLLNSIQKGLLKFILGVAIVFFMFITFLSTFFNVKTINILEEAMPNSTLPLHVGNYPAYVSLAKELENLTKNNERLTILSSNDVLNDSILNTISDNKLDSKISYTSQVDLRDKLNIQALRANFFVVTDPIQLHLIESGQRVISVPANSILHNQNIGHAFKKLDHEYQLNDSVSAWIYERTRPYRLGEINEFLNIFYDYYPKWKDIYNTGIIKSYLTAKIVTGDIWGNFYLINSENNYPEFFAHPGENTPTKVTWVLSGVKSLLLKATGTDCNIDDTILVEISGSGIPAKIVQIPKGNTMLLDVIPWDNKLSTLTISKNKSSSCDSLNISAQY